MPPKKKDKKTTERIKPFKTDEKSVWYIRKHYQVINGEVILVAGGILVEEELNYVQKYFKRKKLI